MVSRDYFKEMAKIEGFLQKHQYAEVAQTCRLLLENLLKDVYSEIKVRSKTGDMKRLLDVEESVAQGKDNVYGFSLDQMADLFQKGQVMDLAETILGKTLELASHIPLRKLGDIIQNCLQPDRIVTFQEIRFLCDSIRMLLKELGPFDDRASSLPPNSFSEQTQANPGKKTVCPDCGESLETGWEFCPACEAPVVKLICPQCALAVKENWKRCPHCKAKLICASCGERLPKGNLTCQECESQESAGIHHSPLFLDSITGMEFVFVPGGRFKMGDTFGDGLEDEIPIHEVKLDGFYLGKYPVTQGQWKQVMKDNPSKFQRGDDHPVEQVNWEDIQTFIQKLTEMHNGKYRFSLPTEAQWEYAARSGGKEEKYSGGDDAGAVAWCQENSNESTHPVGKKKPNGLGIYDMSGNVWEWCLDVYKKDAYSVPQKEDGVSTQNGVYRVIRGGSWNTDSWSVRCARRFGFISQYFAAGLGFRLLRYP